MKNILKVLGPGILFASTAIGVSHLVQSTRAGAGYGFALLWAVLAANLFKYPFFEYGSRYANSTGESIIDGYKRIGNWMLWLYFFLTIGSMFFIVAAVGFVTAGFCDNLFGLSALVSGFKLFPVLLVFVVCTGILLAGKFKALDGLIKIIGIVLLFSTLLAFALTLAHGPIPKVDTFIKPEVWSNSGILFIIALMGWMPTALDLSSWNSLWTLERIKQTGYHPTMKETLFDFNFGYWAAAILSVCFVTMGAFLIYGSGVEMPGSSAKFANKVVELYTTTIGQWSYLIIASAAFSIMIGTTLGVFDGYARSIERTTELLFMSEENAKLALNDRKVYIISLLVCAIGGFAIIAFFMNHFKALVDLATTISFLIAPLIAIVNFRLVSKKYLKEEHVPPKWMQILSYTGILFLSGFSLFYIYVKLIR